MQIKNPINEAITGVKIGENIYSIEANGTLDNVPEKDARFWQENLHKFLILRKDKLEEVKEVEVVEIPTPKVEEVVSDEIIVPEVVEEEVIETPIVKEKKSIFSKSKK